MRHCTAVPNSAPSVHPLGLTLGLVPHATIAYCCSGRAAPGWSLVVQGIEAFEHPNSRTFLPLACIWAQDYAALLLAGLTVATVTMESHNHSVTCQMRKWYGNAHLSPHSVQLYMQCIVVRSTGSIDSLRVRTGGVVLNTSPQHDATRSQKPRPKMAARQFFQILPNSPNSMA